MSMVTKYLFTLSKLEISCPDSLIHLVQLKRFVEMRQDLEVLFSIWKQKFSKEFYNLHLIIT